MPETDPLDPDRLLGLPPGIKIFVGGLLTLLCGGITLALLGGGVLIYGGITFFGMIGIAMVVTGIGELAAERAQARELARVDAEWDQIVAAVGAQTRRGHGATRTLQGMGFSYPTRKLIQERLQDVEVPMPTFADAALGKLVFDPARGVLKTELPVADRTLEVHIQPDAEGMPGAGLERAKALRSRLPELLARTEDYALDRLLEFKNREWTRPGHAPTSEAAFRAALRPIALRFHNDDRMAVVVDPGALFGDHVFQVEYDASGAPSAITFDSPTRAS